MVLPIRDDNPTERPPVVTLLLIAACTFVFLAVQPGAGSEEEALFLYRNAAVPCELSTGEHVTYYEANTGQCLRADAAGFETGFGSRVEIAPTKNVYLAALWSMFLHGSFAHLAGNMLFLWIFGNNIEDRLGPVLFAVFYLLVGVAATVAHVAGDANSVIPVIGASGAIAGVMGAYLVWFPHARILCLFGWFPIYLPAVVVLGLWFVLQFGISPEEGVAWVAHVGGFVTGAVLAFALRGVFGPRPRAAGYGDDRDGGFRGGYPGRL